MLELLDLLFGLVVSNILVGGGSGGGGNGGGSGCDTQPGGCPNPR